MAPVVEPNYHPGLRVPTFFSSGTIGFQAGDTNLYRYVSNSPVVNLDASGLQEVPSIGGKDGELLEPKPLLPIIGSPKSKADSLKGVSICGQKDLDAVPKDCRLKQVGRENWWTGKVPDGWLAGPYGCGPCVGLILVPETAGQGNTFVLHWSGAEWIKEGLRSCGFFEERRYKIDKEFGGSFTVSSDFPKQNYRAIICGCESQPYNKEGDALRLYTLQTVCGVLQMHKIKIQCYVPAPNVGVDKNGKPHWTTPDSTPTDKYDK